jgi:hypothetical protein
METPRALLPETAFCREQCAGLDGTLGQCALLRLISSTSHIPPATYDSLEVVCTLAIHERAVANTED